MGTTFRELSDNPSYDVITLLFYVNFIMMWLKTEVSANLSICTVCSIRVPPLTYWANSAGMYIRLETNKASYMQASKNTVRGKQQTSNMLR